uniref:Uncharacterized protein n=1 Tax=Panagrolaimus sp. JU765 TaxID=591449 RepID=A0AC34R148_9BILA
MADHGARFTALRQTSQGQLEERMPFFSVYLPEKLRSHPSFENLRENADRLTTPFDIHSTFLDLLNISEIPEEDFTKEPLGPLKRSLSLLRPIPANRTCKDANVEPHWCSCVAWRPIKNSSHLQNLGKNIVEKIVSVFNGFLKEEPGLCATLKLAKIEKMERLAPDDGVLTYNGVKDADGFDPKFKQDKIIKDFVTYRLSFWTEPGMAHYEVTVEYNEATKELKMDPQAISH